jgi:uncharacterized protein (DUF342 family)
VEIKDDGMIMTASLDGKVDIDSDGKISVFEEWTIEGDIGPSTGHVEFWGKELLVTGSVSGGYRVNVAGNLSVDGNIEDEGHVHAGGDVVVKGIIRSGATTVLVDRNLECGAIEYANVKVDGNLVVNDYMLDAYVDVRGNVAIVNGNGLVAGGKLRAGGNIQAGRLGTSANVFTKVHAGYDPVLMELEHELLNEIKELYQKGMKLKEGLEKIRNIKNGNGKSEKIKSDITKALKTIHSEIESKKKEIDSIEQQIKTLEESTIQVLGVTFPNVLISINNADLKVKLEIKAAIFRFQKGRIVVITP